MSNNITFTFRLLVNGKEQIVSATADAKHLADSLKRCETHSTNFVMPSLI